MVSITALESLDCEMPPEALKRFSAKKDQFQMMPEAAIRALELIKDPACDLSLVAKTIEQDVKLTASIISVANSPLFCPGRPITTVRTAIINVGFHQCQSLIQGCCAKSLMQSIGISRYAGDAIMHRCLATAAIASSINVTLKLGFQGEEFAAGLLHDLGRLLLGVLFPDAFPQLHDIHIEDGDDSLLLEQRVVGTDHTVVGCHFAIANRLPDTLKEAIRYHHTPMKAEISPRLTTLTAVADQMAKHFLIDIDAVYDLSSNRHHLAFESVFGRDVSDKFESRIPGVFELASKTYTSFRI